MRLVGKGRDHRSGDRCHGLHYHRRRGHHRIDHHDRLEDIHVRGRRTRVQAVRGRGYPAKLEAGQSKLKAMHWDSLPVGHILHKRRMGVFAVCDEIRTRR